MTTTSPPRQPGVPSATLRARAARWLRRNLFRGPVDGVITVLTALVTVYVLYRLARFIGVTGRWDVIRVNLSLVLVGRYPRADLWRPAVALWAATGIAGIGAGVLHRRQRDAGETDEAAPDADRVRWGLQLLQRVWPLAIAVFLLLLLARTITPWLVVLAALVAWGVGRVVGARLPRRVHVVVGMAALLLPFVMVWFLSGPVGWNDWGGMMLNIFLATVAIILCFPLGVLLALGRRSTLPLVRAVSTGYIELFRGSPLYVLLLMASVALGFFVPQSLVPGKVVRAIVVLTLFTAAYVAEIVRGGLQSVPKGQEEAGKALGLSPSRVTFWIVLPQALRNVIPAQVGQFITLFKDTTLVGAAMGVFEALSASEALTAQPDFRGLGLFAEVFAFVLFLFWVGSFTMSRESQRIEKKLGVGTR